MAKNFYLRAVGNDDTVVFEAGAKRRSLQSLINYLKALTSGARAGVTIYGGDTAVAATGTLTLSSASGTVGGTINGTAVTVTASGGDTATAAALATAINGAAAIVSGHVLATAAAGVVTLTSLFPGLPGNAVTLVASGTGVTASGTRLTGGSVTESAFVF